MTGDLSTESFILALRRFRARRGNPSTIRSDNGTNFVGAEKELAQALKELNQSKITEELSNHEIEWNFNPPASPWMGGAMESMVKVTKKALKTIVKDRLFTEEALHTFLTEIESTVNCRPLTEISDDIEDYEALTPNHFLIGRSSPNTSPVTPTEDTNIRSKWRSVQAATEMFWKRFIKEYLPTLTKRNKWTTLQQNMQVGDLVILNEKNLLRSKWLLGRITKTMPGNDDVVRVVEVKTPTGYLIRPVGSLSLLEEAGRSGM